MVLQKPECLLLKNCSRILLVGTSLLVDITQAYKQGEHEIITGQETQQNTVISIRMKLKL